MKPEVGLLVVPVVDEAEFGNNISDTLPTPLGLEDADGLGGMTFWGDGGWF